MRAPNACSSPDCTDAAVATGVTAVISFNDLMAGFKSALNQATNQNQQAIINYQSLINQRDQMVEWVANLITVLGSAAAQVAASLR